MPTILFIGTPKDAIPSIAYASTLGYDILACDGDALSPGLAWVRKYGIDGAIISVYDSQAILKEVYRNGWHKYIDGVMAVATDCGWIVSQVAEALSLPCIPSNISILSRNKVNLKEQLVKGDIPVPGTADIVIKPVDGRGSRGLYFLAASGLDLPSVTDARSQSQVNQVIFERYITGPQVSTESIVYRGVAHTYLTDRDYSRGIYEAGGFAPSCFEGTVKGEEIKALIQQVVNVLGVQNGTVKGDVVLDSEYDFRPTLIEMAIGRISGGNSALMYLGLGYGIDFIGAACALACGNNPLPYLSQKRPRHFVRGVFEMSGIVTCNKERGKFFLGIGKTRQEADQKAVRWLRKRND